MSVRRHRYIARWRVLYKIARLVSAREPSPAEPSRDQQHARAGCLSYRRRGPTAAGAPRPSITCPKGADAPAPLWDIAATMGHSGGLAALAGFEAETAHADLKNFLNLARASLSHSTFLYKLTGVVNLIPSFSLLVIGCYSTNHQDY